MVHRVYEEYVFIVTKKTDHVLCNSHLELPVQTTVIQSAFITSSLLSSRKIRAVK
jgi:hypothetical protein